MKMSGIVFSNIHDAEISELTKNRTVASVPFGGRYRLIDFVLSNMVNSGIKKIGVITKYNYQSLIDHLGSCSEWDLNVKNSGLYIIPPYSNGPTTIYRGKIEAISGAMSFLYKCNTKYVLISDSTVICNIDFRKALSAHIESGADVTVICSKDKALYRGERRDLVLRLKNDKVSDVMVNAKFEKEDLCSMGMYIMETDMLMNIVENCMTRGRYHFETDFLQYEFNNSHISINAYEFCRTVLRTENVINYFTNNLRLMDESVRDDIFATGAPIYTKVRDEVPTFYGKGCKVNECLIADGCNIQGYVENSVIFRNVTIEKGCSVKNSIIMQGSKVGKGADINYVILDKDVTISNYSTLAGSGLTPLIIGKKEVV